MSNAPSIGSPVMKKEWDQAASGLSICIPFSAVSLMVVWQDAVRPIKTHSTNLCGFSLGTDGGPIGEATDPGSCGKTTVKGVFHYAENRDWNLHGTTRLSRCNRFRCVDFRDWIFQNEQWSFWKILTEICKKLIIERTRLFLCNRFHCAENWLSPSRFFSGSGWSLWIFMLQDCCAWRNNRYILAETVITNAACAAAAFIFVIIIYVHYFHLLSRTFDPWRQFDIIVNRATRDLD